MSAVAWSEQIRALPDDASRRRFVLQHCDDLTEDTASQLKTQADQVLETDVQSSLEVARLMRLIGGVTGRASYTIFGLLAEANALSIGGLGEYHAAIDLYEQAAGLCRARDDEVGAAKAQVGQVFSLAMVGQYEDALALGRQIAPQLERNGQWRPLITLTLNLAIVHGRQRSDTQALAEFDRARALTKHIGRDGRSLLALIEANRAIVLRNLGRFDESIHASRLAGEIQNELDALTAQGHVQLDLAATYLFLGRTNEALELLYSARDAFFRDGRIAYAIEADLGISHCLLQLRRFADVLETCRDIRWLFGNSGRNREVAETALVEAAAYTGLKRYDEALAAVKEARRLFEAEGNDVWIARVDLDAAALLFHVGQFVPSLASAQRCADLFRSRGLVVDEAQARLVVARNHQALQRVSEARQSLLAALAIGESKGLADLIYPCHHLLGQLDEDARLPDSALRQYDQAIVALERLRGRLMVEFRADFLQDKQAVYEDAVRLCVQTEQVELALAYAERAKSRALQDLIAYRLDLSVHARSPGDDALVAELTGLRAERDRLARRSNGAQALSHGDWLASSELAADRQRELGALEKRITDLWHKLLVRSADYARDASLWEVRAEPVQPFLAADTALVEYFAVDGRLMAFVVTRKAHHARLLEVDEVRVQQMLRMLQLNLKTVPRSRPEMAPALIANANGILAHLGQHLVAPIADLIAPAAKLIVVPHGVLHYLPFHALRDEHGYLVERYEMSYLPGASLLRFVAEPRASGAGMVAVGHSCDGLLPHAVDEALGIAEMFQGQALLERDATAARLASLAARCRTLHLAAHGDFRPDNPLFSGLFLEDGWLTTLDIFGMRLNASLVTLSACQTGRNVISGGDELLGLMRALLYAGAASLVLSLWPVEDRSTAELMQSFYTALAAGASKGAALRQAQLAFVHRRHGEELAEVYAHPYFWAPFFLVGDSGSL